jgi:hypothetical protein
VARRTAGRYVALPRRLDQPTFGQPDEDRIEGAGLDSERARQLVPVAPVGGALRKGREHGPRLRGRLARVLHNPILYLDRDFGKDSSLPTSSRYLKYRVLSVP